MFIFMYCACENHTFNVTPTHRLQQHRSFFQQTARIACFFCEGCTWHHLHMLVEEPLCCDWKGRAARAKTFTLWHQFRFIRPRIKHFNKTQHDSNKGDAHCGTKQQYRSHVVLILYLLVRATRMLFITRIPFVVNCTFPHNADWEAATLAEGLG